MAGKLLLGNRTIALLFAGETPIQRVVLGGRVVWASLLRLPAEQRSAIKMAILSEGSTAEAEGMGIGLRAVFVSDSSASLLGVGGFSTGQAGRMEYKISPILITVCKPRFDGTARIREKETAQLYCSGGMAYRDRAGVLAALLSGRPAAGTAGHGRGSARIWDSGGALTAIAGGWCAEKAQTSTANGASLSKRAGFGLAAALGVRPVSDEPWAAQDGSTLTVYRAWQGTQTERILEVM